MSTRPGSPCFDNWPDVTTRRASNANDWRNRVGVVLDQLSNFRMGKILSFTIGKPLMHVRPLSSVSPPVSPSISLLSFPLLSSHLYLFSFSSLTISVSLLFFSFISSSLLFASVWCVLCCAVLCCTVLCCAVLCCCVLLYVVVLLSLVVLCVCVSLCHVSGVEQCVQVMRRISGIGNVPSKTYSFVEPLGHVIPLRGQILVCRTDDDPPRPPLPCVHPKRPRVYRQHVHICKHMWSCCQYTRGRLGGTHGVFQRVTPHTTPHTTTTTATATHNNDNDNDTQRQRQRRRQPTCSFIRLNREKPTRCRHSKD